MEDFGVLGRQMYLYALKRILQFSAQSCNESRSFKQSSASWRLSPARSLPGTSSQHDIEAASFACAPFLSVVLPESLDLNINSLRPGAHAVTFNHTLAHGRFDVWNQ